MSENNIDATNVSVQSHEECENVTPEQIKENSSTQSHEECENVTPEQIKELSKRLDTMEQLLQTIGSSNASITESLSHNSSRINDINASLEGLRSYLADSTKRIRRFEEGYDFQILKNFSKQLIREIYTLENQLEKVDSDDKKELIQNIIDGLIELLDRNSIVQIEPEIGSLYAGQERNIECASVKTFTENENLNGRIASVVHCGFLYEFNDGSSRVIAPAKVVLYSNEKEQSLEEEAEISALSESAKRGLRHFTKIFEKITGTPENK